MDLTKVVLAALGLLLVGIPVARGQQPAEEELAIERIVLYKHGVGYFERGGVVDGDAVIPLAFKSREMKDVLKSLFAVDLDGGRISTILYDSQDPIAKQLEDILFKVPEEAALTRFLTQLKGARIRVQLGTETIEGRVLGIEPIKTQSEHGQTLTHKLVLLDEGGAIRPLDLLDATSLTVLDASLRADLDRMMEIYAKARYADRKVVQLRAEGEGERKLRVGYVIETPIWKTSYRLLFEDQRPPLLQGWAIVENTTDEDWKEVMLSFVAGSPMSFVMDLYTSYYPQRPVLDMGIAAAPTQAPMDSGRPGRSFAGREVRKLERARKSNRGPLSISPDPSEDADHKVWGELLEKSVEPLTRGIEVGDLFAYEAKSPVTIRRGQAALVPILTSGLPEASRVLYFDAALSRHPSHACYLQNSTELTLEKGPVTVFEGSTCLGEALLPRTLKSGDHQILPFALEPAVEVEARGESKVQPVTRARIADGVMILYRKEVAERRYRIRNRTGKAWTLYLDHGKSGGNFALTEPARPAEELRSGYRFKLELPARDVKDLTVREERQTGASLQVSQLNAEQIALYVREPYLSEGARRFLAQVATLMEERATVARSIVAARDELKRLGKDQERLRENMRVLRESPKERTIREQYLERLLAADQAIEALGQKLRENAVEQQKLDARLAEKIRSFGE